MNINPLEINEASAVISQPISLNVVRSTTVQFDFDLVERTTPFKFHPKQSLIAGVNNLKQVLAQACFSILPSCQQFSTVITLGNAGA